MFLRRLRSQLAYWWSQNYHPDQSGRYERKGLVSSLDPQLYRAYTVVGGCQVKLSVLHTHLNDYTRALRYASACLRGDGELDNRWGIQEYQEVTLQTLLTPKHFNKGQQHAPHTEISEFKQAASEFLTHYERLSPNTLGDSYTLRILGKFQANVLYITNAMVRHSHRL